MEDNFAVKDSFAVVVDLDMVDAVAVATLFVEDLVVEDVNDNLIAEDYSSSFVKEAFVEEEGVLVHCIAVVALTFDCYFAMALISCYYSVADIVLEEVACYAMEHYYYYYIASSCCFVVAIGHAALQKMIVVVVLVDHSHLQCIDA